MNQNYNIEATSSHIVVAERAAVCKNQNARHGGENGEECDSDDPKAKEGHQFAAAWLNSLFLFNFLNLLNIGYHDIFGVWTRCSCHSEFSLLLVS